MRNDFLSIAMSSLAGGKELDTMLIDVRPLPLCYIPRRYLHAILFFFGVVGAYLLRYTR